MNTEELLQEVVDEITRFQERIEILLGLAEDLGIYPGERG